MTITLTWTTGIVVVACIGMLTTVGMWIGRVNSDRDSFREFMKKIEKEIKSINKKLEKIFLLLPEPIERTTSPISLTDYGKKLAGKIGASEISDMKLSEVTIQVKGFNAYQVQEHCFAFSRGELLEQLKDENPDI